MLALTCASMGSLESVGSPVCYWCAAAVILRARLLLLAVSQWFVHVQYPKSHFLSDWWAAQWTAGTGAAVLEPCWGICLSIAAPRILHFNHGLLTNIYLSIIYLKENQKLLTVHSRTGKEILVLLFPLYENLTHYFVFIFIFCFSIVASWSLLNETICSNALNSVVPFKESSRWGKHESFNYVQVTFHYVVTNFFFFL